MNPFCHHDIQRIYVDSTTTPYSVNCGDCKEEIGQGIAQMIDVILTKAKYGIEEARDRIKTLEKKVEDLEYRLPDK